MELQHTYYLGRSGSGKTTLMQHAIIDAIKDNDGVFYLDPHGSDIDTILQYIPQKRRKDVILFDPSQFIVSYNPLDTIHDIDTDARAILYALKDIWKFSDISTAVFDDYVLHSLYALIQSPYPTLIGVSHFLISSQFRERILNDSTDRQVQAFFDEYQTLTPKEKRQEHRSSVNKFNVLNLDTRLRRTLGQRTSAFAMSDVLEGKIFLARLPQGVLGLDVTRLFGILLLTQLHMAGLRRTSDRPFHVFIDEVHHFQGMALKEMMSGIRKYNIAMHVVHQYLRQLNDDMRDAIIGNTAVQNIFKIGRSDATYFLSEFGANNVDDKYDELPRHEYRSGPTGQYPVDPLPTPRGNAHKTIKTARERYSRNVRDIDAELDRFYDLI